MTETNALPVTETETAVAVIDPASLPWADVQPDHFQMLRLAPLPTDRHTGARPLRFVQFGRVERHNKEKDLSLLRMSIQLPGQRVRKEQNTLDIWVDHATRRVKIGLETGLQIEPWNRGIGRFVLAQGIQWAQKKWGSYMLEGAVLANKDALNEDTRLRRDHFLRKHGLEVIYADAQHMKGSVKETQVGLLHGTWNTEKVQILEILDAANMLQQAEQNLLEQEITLRKQEDRVSKFKREDSSLRFTIACLVTFAVFQAALLVWIATHR